MKKLFFLWFGVSVLASAQLPGSSFNIGQKLPSGMLEYLPKQHCLTAPSHVDPCVRVRLRGVIYTIGFQQSSRTVTYLETHDPAFATESQLSVGSRLQEGAGRLTWKDEFGEVAAPPTNDQWEPIVAFDGRLDCGKGPAIQLDASNPQNPQPCAVRVLAFKKRAHPPEAEARLKSCSFNGH